MPEGASQREDLFAAFISYSHKDAEWGRWVQRELERYRLPADFASAQGLNRKLGKVFRDREELPTGQNLGEHLTRALDSSRNLIVICSSHAKESPWVAKEIEYFKALGKGDRIFCLLVEGGAENLPTPLLTDADGNPLEPLAADPRENGDGKRLAKLKLISGLVDTNLDQLARREYARRQRQFLGWSVAALLLISVTGGLAGAAYFFEQQRAAEVARNVETATRLSTRIEEAYDYLDKTSLEINAQIISEYLDDIDDSELTSEQQVAIARTLRTQGNAAYRLGKVEKALTDLERSRGLYENLAKENPTDVDAAIEFAFANFYLASTHYYEGDFQSAIAPMEKYASDIGSLYTEHPNHPLLLAESVYAPTAVLGLLNDARSRFSNELEERVDRVVAAADAAIQMAPNDRDIIDAYSAAMYHGANAYMKSCRVFDSLPLRKNAVANARRAQSLDPANREYKRELATSLTAQGDGLMNSLQITEGIESYLEAIEIYEELLASDPENMYQRRQLLRAKIVLLATSVYHPEETGEIPEIGLLAQELKKKEEHSLAKALDLELLYLSRLSEAAIAAADYSLATELLDGFIAVARADNEEDAGRFELLYELRRLLVRNLEGDQNLPIIDQLTDQDTPLPPNFADTMGRLKSGEDCASKQFAWYGHVLAGDMDSANQIANELWCKGSRGLEIAFMAKQLGIPHPPE